MWLWQTHPYFHLSNPTGITYQTWCKPRSWRWCISNYWRACMLNLWKPALVSIATGVSTPRLQWNITCPSIFILRMKKGDPETLPNWRNATTLYAAEHVCHRESFQNLLARAPNRVGAAKYSLGKSPETRHWCFRDRRLDRGFPLWHPIKLAAQEASPTRSEQQRCLCLGKALRAIR